MPEKSTSPFSPRVQPQVAEEADIEALIPAEVRALATQLDTCLPHDWEIFLRPHMNGDQPDIVLFKPQVGVTIIEIVTWEANAYVGRCEKIVVKGKSIQKQKVYRIAEEGEIEVANPVRCLRSYKDRLQHLYFPELGELMAKSRKQATLVKGVLYFSSMATKQARELVGPTKAPVLVLGVDSPVENLARLLTPQGEDSSTMMIEADLAARLRLWLVPSMHKIEDGIPIHLTSEQQQSVHSSPKAHQRLRGVAGSGKTLVLAQRAAMAASEGKRVLIVSFNITLLHYIRYHLARAAVKYDWGLIETLHFHGFCKRYIDENYGAWGEGEGEEFFARRVPEQVLTMLKAGKNARHRVYDVVLIDEGQDFHPLWYEVLCRFLSSNDELLLISDDRQNVYKRDTAWVDSMTGTRFRGRWRELKASFRLPDLIRKEANRFAKEFLPGVGQEVASSQLSLGLGEPHLIWRNVPTLRTAIEKSFAAVRWLVGTSGLKPSDIVVLVPDHKEGKCFVDEAKKEFRNSEKGQTIELNDIFGSQSKKYSFVMNDARLKVCTIHSFKGWELPNIILLTPPDEDSAHGSLDMLLYVAITRARNNLIVFNRSPKYSAYGEGWPNTWE
jgi:hypothetical protein